MRRWLADASDQRPRPTTRTPQPSAERPFTSVTPPKEMSAALSDMRDSDVHTQKSLEFTSLMMTEPRSARQHSGLRTQSQRLHHRGGHRRGGDHADRRRSGDHEAGRGAGRAAVGTSDVGAL